MSFVTQGSAGLAVGAELNVQVSADTSAAARFAAIVSAAVTIACMNALSTTIAESFDEKPFARYSGGNVACACFVVSPMFAATELSYSRRDSIHTRRSVVTFTHGAGAPPVPADEPPVPPPAFPEGPVGAPMNPAGPAISPVHALISTTTTRDAEAGRSHIVTAHPCTMWARLRPRMFPGYRWISRDVTTAR